MSKKEKVVYIIAIGRERKEASREAVLYVTH